MHSWKVIRRPKNAVCRVQNVKQGAAALNFPNDSAVGGTSVRLRYNEKHYARS